MYACTLFVTLYSDNVKYGHFSWVVLQFKMCVDIAPRGKLQESTCDIVNDNL